MCDTKFQVTQIERRAVANIFKTHISIPAPFTSSNRIPLTTHENIDLSITGIIVIAAIGHVRAGTAAGHDELSVDHVKHAGGAIVRMLLTITIKHGYLPKSCNYTYYKV